MYLYAKFGDHRSYRNGHINSFINSYIDTLEKAELTALIHHIGRFLKSGIPIYNSAVLDTAGRKTRRRRGRRRRTWQSVKSFRRTHLENINMKISELSESYCASDINKILKTLHTRKTDGIPIKIIKTARNVTESQLANLVNKDLDSNKFSRSAKTALFKAIT